MYVLVGCVGGCGFLFLRGAFYNVSHEWCVGCMVGAGQTFFAIGCFYFEEVRGGGWGVHSLGVIVL